MSRRSYGRVVPRLKHARGVHPFLRGERVSLQSGRETKDDTEQRSGERRGKREGGRFPYLSLLLTRP